MAKGIRRLAAAAAWRLRSYCALFLARRQSRRALSINPLRRLLVVCYGNINRSAYSGSQLRHQLAGVAEVRSVGFHPVVDRPSPPLLVEWARQAGVSLDGHRSALIAEPDLAWADTIILMDRHHWQALRRMGADPRKLVWLGTQDGGVEIADPYGAPEQEARQIMHRVHRCTETLAAAVASRRGSSEA